MFTLIALFVTAMIAPLSNTLVFANESQLKVSVDEKSNFSKEDILPLEKYISVKKGFFEFDIKKAKADGFKKELLNGQQKYLQQLNSEIAKGNLKASSNLNVETIRPDESLMASDINIAASCGGITTSKTTYWWGYSRKMNSCLTDKVAADFASASSVAAGVAVVAGIWGVAPAVPAGLTAAYWGLVSSRLYANNSESTGVVFDMTWAYVFDIEPQ